METAACGGASRNQPVGGIGYEGWCRRCGTRAENEWYLCAEIRHRNIPPVYAFDSCQNSQMHKIHTWMRNCTMKHHSTGMTLAEWPSRLIQVIQSGVIQQTKCISFPAASVTIIIVNCRSHINHSLITAFINICNYLRFSIQLNLYICTHVLALLVMIASYCCRIAAVWAYA